METFWYRHCPGKWPLDECHHLWSSFVNFLCTEFYWFKWELKVQLDSDCCQYNCYCHSSLRAVQSVSITQTLGLLHSWTTTLAPTTTISTRYSTSTWHVHCSTVCVVTCCSAGGVAYFRATASSLHRITSMRSYMLSRWATASLRSSCVVSNSEVEQLFCQNLADRLFHKILVTVGDS